MDIDTVVTAMLNAAKVPLANYWTAAEPIAKAEFTKIAQEINQIGIDRLTQTITPQDAKDRLSLVTDESTVAMDTQIGLAELAAQNAINAALAAVSGIVNGYLGFALI